MSHPRTIILALGEVSWDGRSASGDPVAAGIYVMELVAGAERRVHKLVRLASR